MSLFKSKSLRPDQLNEHGQVTDTKILNRERFKFGFGTILYQSEEMGIGAVPTVIIRALGGDAFHLGIYGAVGGITSVFQWVGTLLLRYFNSNRKAMIAAMMAGFLISALIVGAIFASHHPSVKPSALWAYLILALMFSAIGGAQWNIESSWIGDLVPKNRLGWFTSMKWILGVLGILVSSIVFARMCDWRPHTSTYAGIYAVFCCSFILAAILYLTVTDRIPKNAYFFSAGTAHRNRLNYASLPLWCYIFYFFFWHGGRGAMFTFASAYLLDQFHSSVTEIALIFAGQYAVSIAMLFFMGKITDKKGHRLLLMAVSVIVALAMILWISSAWLGMVPIIIYQFLNGAAGHTHSMLSTNYALEIFPDKGRSGYLAFSRLCIGFVIMLAVITAGVYMRVIAGWHCELWGATLNHYHLLFTICSVISLCSVIPLMIAGKRTVSEG